MLCDLLVSHFDHHSYRSIAVVEDRSAVTAVNVDLCPRSLSGLILCSSVFVVSYWTFPCPLFFPTLPIIYGEPSSSNQCLCRCSKASISSALSLCAQPTHQFSLISLGTATRHISSPRPTAPPSSPRRRGQRATVSLCPCRVLLRLCRNDVVLCDPLISHFDHHSYRSIAVVEDRSAVTAVNVNPCHQSLSGLVLCSNVFVVSYWTFPCPLFHRFRLHFAGVA